MKLFESEEIPLPIIGSTGYYQIDKLQPGITLTLVYKSEQETEYLLTLRKDEELAVLHGYKGKKSGEWTIAWKDGRKANRIYKNKQTAALAAVEIFLSEEAY